VDNACEMFKNKVNKLWEFQEFEINFGEFKNIKLKKPLIHIDKLWEKYKNQE